MMSSMMKLEATSSGSRSLSQRDESMPAAFIQDLPRKGPYQAGPRKNTKRAATRTPHQLMMTPSMSCPLLCLKSRSLVKGGGSRQSVEIQRQSAAQEKREPPGSLFF